MASDEWVVRFETEAANDLARLPNRRLIREAIEIAEDLGHDPIPEGVKPMRRHKDAYRVYFGSRQYQIVYRVNKASKVVTVFAVGPRHAVYKGIRG
jgi:mRNA-degrading endonuclease RelE of RelBE toxin-antitoxin system